MPRATSTCSTWWSSRRSSRSSSYRVASRVPRLFSAHSRRSLPSARPACERSAWRALRARVLRPTLAGQRLGFASVASSSPTRQGRDQRAANGACARELEAPALPAPRYSCRRAASARCSAMVAPAGAGPIRGTLAGAQPGRWRRGVGGEPSRWPASVGRRMRVTPARYRSRLGTPACENQAASGAAAPRRLLTQASKPSTANLHHSRFSSGGCSDRITGTSTAATRPAAKPLL